jgi:hypothetical protein
LFNRRYNLPTTILEALVLGIYAVGATSLVTVRKTPFPKKGKL